MTEPIRWYRTQLQVAGGVQILWVSAADVLSALERGQEEELHDLIEGMLLAEQPVPDTIPEDF